MQYYLKRVIPVLNHLEETDWNVLISQIKPFIKEILPQERELSGTMILTDSPEGVSLAKEAGLPCLGLELSGQESLSCSYAVTDLSAVTQEYLERIYRRFYNVPWEILESERCIVREGNEEDVEEILNVYEDIEEFSLTRPFDTLEEGQRYMQDYREMVYRFYEYGLWVVEEKASGALIGVAGLENQVFQKEEYLALGYVIKKEWRRQGYAEEVCRAILVYGETEFGLEEVHCFVELENEASARLVEKLGFCREGTTIQQKGENGGQEAMLYHYIWKNSREATENE